MKNTVPSSAVTLWISRAGWAALAFIFAFPVLWMILGSFKATNQELFEHPFAWPSQIAWDNYSKAMIQGRIPDYLINSLLVTGMSVVLTVILGAWAGYALAKIDFPFRRTWLGLIFLGMILPVQSILFPLIELLDRLGLHDSLWGLTLAYVSQSLPTAIWLMAAYFKALPRDLEEAARIDGMSTARFYLSIVLPMAKPGVATVVVITCLNTWNEFLLAMLLIFDPIRKTMPVGMIAFESTHNTFYPALLAGLSLISIPTLIVYALFNRQVMSGAAAGAVK